MRDHKFLLMRGLALWHHGVEEEEEEEAEVAVLYIAGRDEPRDKSASFFTQSESDLALRLDGLVEEEAEGSLRQLQQMRQLLVTFLFLICTALDASQQGEPSSVLAPPAAVVDDDVHSPPLLPWRRVFLSFAPTDFSLCCFLLRSDLPPPLFYIVPHEQHVQVPFLQRRTIELAEFVFRFVSRAWGEKRREGRISNVPVQQNVTLVLLPPLLLLVSHGSEL